MRKLCRRPSAPVLALLAGLLVPASSPIQALAQDGDPVLTRTGDKTTRKAKKEKKAMKAEQKRAREQRRRLEEADKRKGKDSKKWKKMGLEAQEATAWYSDALRRYKGGKYLQAREILLPLEDSPRALEIQDKVKLLIADTYYYQSGSLNLAEALARYRAFLTFYPGNDHAEYAQFQLGNCYYKQLGAPDRDQSHTDSTIAEYDRLLRQYPNGEYAEQARQRSLEAKALRARHEFEVGKYYFERKSYPAAAQRMSRLLTERPESPDREEALYLASASYYQLGEVGLAESYALRLKEDYPASSLPGKLSRNSTQALHSTVAKRERHREKEKARTHARQVRRDKKRTRRIRHDSGLRKDVPLTAEYSGPATVAPVALTKKQIAREQKAAKAAEKERKNMERLESEEQAQRQKQLEAEMAAEAKAKNKPAKTVDPEKDAKTTAKEEAKAAKEAARMEKLEAEEQEEAKKKAEREAKKAEKEAEKAKKKLKKASKTN